MNTSDHLKLLKKTMTHDSVNTSMVKSIDSIWCKGDRQIYTNVVALLADSIRYFWNVRLYINRDFKHIFYPVSRGIKRYDYQCLKVFDKYFKTTNNCEALFNRAIKRSSLEIFKLPKVIRSIVIEIDGVRQASSNSMSLTHVIDARYALKFELLDVLLTDSLAVERIINGLVDSRDVTIHLDGEPHSVSHTLSVESVIEFGEVVSANNQTKISKITCTIPHEI